MHQAPTSSPTPDYVSSSLVSLKFYSSVTNAVQACPPLVTLVRMVLPFGIGAGFVVAIYNRFTDRSIKFTHFMLFTGVENSIAALLVLSRLSTELDYTVGIVVLSAGVVNGINAYSYPWSFPPSSSHRLQLVEPLALSIVLVNAGLGLTAVYILLVRVGCTLFRLFPIKMTMQWLARTMGSIESGPTLFFMTVIGSAFPTDTIGVHALFGTFLAE